MRREPCSAMLGRDGSPATPKAVATVSTHHFICLACIECKFCLLELSGIYKKYFWFSGGVFICRNCGHRGLGSSLSSLQQALTGGPCPTQCTLSGALPKAPPAQLEVPLIYSQSPTQNLCLWMCHPAGPPPPALLNLLRHCPSPGFSVFNPGSLALQPLEHSPPCPGAV